MRTHPITWITITAFVVLLLCFSVSIFNSGQQYHKLLAEAVEYRDAELLSAIREKLEHANIFAFIYSIASAFIVFLAWYVACAFIIINRMRSMGIPLARYGIPLLIFAGSAWCAHLILDSRPSTFHYDEYMKYLLASLGLLISGILTSAISMYFCCHLPWRKRITRQVPRGKMCGGGQ